MQTITLESAATKCKKAMDAGDILGVEAASGELELLVKAYPDAWQPLFFLANAFHWMGRNALAIPLYHRCRELAPEEFCIVNNLGTAYREENLTAKAAEVMEAALKLEPANVTAIANLATLHVNEGSPEVAEFWCRKALELNPAHQVSHWNLGLALLEQEKWEEGFKEYSWGIVGKERMKKGYGFARWYDGSRTDQGLVVYGEQGVGDEIMYSSMLHDIAERAPELIFDCHPRLINLFSRSFPFVKAFYPTRKVFTEELAWVKDHNIAFKAALADIGKFFRQKDEDFPRVPYLIPDPELVTEYMMLLQQTGHGPYLGLAWTGGVKQTREDLRSIELEDLAMFVERAGTSVSLQYKGNAGEHDCQRFNEATGLTVHRFPEITDSRVTERYYPLTDGKRIVQSNGEELWFNDKDACKLHIKREGLSGELEMITGKAYDYDHTAALVSAIAALGGCVVSVNTSTVHLCGSLGVPIFVLTPSKPAWRYGVSHVGGQKRKGMIWYPEETLKQYRQKMGEPWKDAIAECFQAVDEFLA